MSGLSLTLAGVTGIIVSIGITVDSYVVFLERLKDASARQIPPGLDVKSFKSAWRTIVSRAHVVSLIGAGVLWYLSVGSVRGFAFFLGLSTILRPRRHLLLRSPARLCPRAVGPGQGGPGRPLRRSCPGGEPGTTGAGIAVSGESFSCAQGQRLASALPTARPLSTSWASAASASPISLARRGPRAISLIFQGLNLGIDFEGGVAWEFQANGQTVDNAAASPRPTASTPSMPRSRPCPSTQRRAPAGPGRRSACRCPDRGQGGLRHPANQTRASTSSARPGARRSR